MTTWSNTFAIILFVNYYLKTMDLPRKNGLIIPTKDFALMVSGDDQHMYGTAKNVTQAYNLIVAAAGADSVHPLLGRKCDPINLNLNTPYSSFISKVLVYRP